MGQQLSSHPDSRIVDTVYGKVQGRRLIYEGDRQVDAFQGIPYAKPPVGPLRFKKPQSPDRWEGIKQTKTWGNRCTQINLFWFESVMKGIPSEDCLYLNVFTPCWEPPKEGFPVMLFIHGGGFLFGDASTYGDIGICENLVPRDVIVVTIHYRVGYLGFFTTGDSACPGNLGLWDQTEALKWVQLNIAAFGGNKNNVTVFGQSAGGASVDLLHLSPHSSGLFHRALAMGGSATCRWATSYRMVEQSKLKVKKLGITDYNNSEELLEKLRALPATSFSVNIVKQEKFDDVDFEAAPVIDGDFFPDTLENLRAKVVAKPLMTGVAKEEGAFFLLDKKKEHFNKNIQEAMPPEFRNDPVLEKKIRQLYNCEELPKDFKEIMLLFAKITSDVAINSGALKLCRQTAEVQDDPVFLYVFEHFNPKSLGFFKYIMPILDATHCAELPYLFHKGILTTFPFTYTPADKHVENIFTTAVTNFAKFGNPNGPDVNRSDLPVMWEPVRGPDYCNNYVITSDEPRMSEDFFEGRTAKYVELLRQYRIDN